MDSPKPTIESETIPEPMREILRRAVSGGIKIDVFSVSGNHLKPWITHVTVWTPWASNLATELKRLGAHDSYMDQFWAMTDEREQCIAWSEPLPEIPRLFRLLAVSDSAHVADGVLWHEGSCSVRWWCSQDSSRAIDYDSLTDPALIRGMGFKTYIEFYPQVWVTPEGKVSETTLPIPGAFTR